LAGFRVRDFVAPRNDASLQRVARDDLFDQVDDGAAEFAVGDAREGADQRQSFGSREEIGDVSRRGRLADAFRVHRGAGDAFEQERHRDLKDFGNLLQAAGADAVGALLVFLDLLEGQPERIAQSFLAHAHHEPAHAHAAADMSVNRIGRFAEHFDLPPGAASLSCRADPV
jgi:hypothetical protein